MTVFRPVRPQRVYVQIVEQISDLIKTGVFSPGASLPPERDLAERLGVSRASLREALSALQVLGLVETKSGQGTFVCAEAPTMLAFDASWLYEDLESPFTILQARKAVEPSIAAIAARQHSDEGLRRIREIHDSVAANLKDAHVFSEGDRKFHLAIAEAAGNPVLVKIMSIIHELMGQRLWLTLRDSTSNTPQRRQEALGDHRKIYEAIAARDARGAAARMRDHLERVERLMIQAELHPAGDQ